jgi:hypothetical protein
VSHAAKVDIVIVARLSCTHVDARRRDLVNETLALIIGVKLRHKRRSLLKRRDLSGPQAVEDRAHALLVKLDSRHSGPHAFDRRRRTRCCRLPDTSHRFEVDQFGARAIGRYDDIVLGDVKVAKFGFLKRRQSTDPDVLIHHLGQAATRRTSDVEARR